ncbi:MAG: hypothetical protein ACRC62_09230 [Microcoleus sp.]
MKSSEKQTIDLYPIYIKAFQRPLLDQRSNINKEERLNSVVQRGAIGYGVR